MYQNGELMPLFLRFHEAIKNNISTRHTIDFYLETLGTNKALLSKACMTASGKSPSLYIKSLIIAKAKILLVSEEILIKEVGERLGFHDTATFVKLFKRMEGMTPNDFRGLHI